MSLDAAIAKLSNHGEADELGGEILAAAMTLRDSSGRDRLPALRSMAATWNVARRHKVNDKLTDRPLPAVADDLEAALCDAALKWLSDSQETVTESTTRGAAEHLETPPPKGSQSVDAGPNSRVEQGAAVEKLKPLVLQSILLARQSMSGALSTSCPRHQMM